jgi:UDP:flavonoid glycosyltransferase YjiC (YdhE family)
MKITITSVGSRGDVQPYVALGRGLQQAGFDVTLAVDELFESFIHSHGLPFAPLSANPMRALEEGSVGMGDNPLQLFSWFRKYVKEIINQHFESMLDACRGADLIIFGSMAFVSLHAAEALKTRALATSLQPIVPTREIPYSTAKIPPDWVPFRGMINKTNYQLYNKMFYRMMLDVINQGREQVLNLPPIPWKFYARLDLSEYWMLNGFSRHVLPKPSDWNDLQYIAGYWFLDQLQDWQPPEELTAFLDGSPAPVYIGFGSMVDMEAAELTQLVIEAVEQAEVRAVLLGGWTDLGSSGLPDSILKMESVPHDWLFPRVSAVVHHGGAGTTAAGLSAGVPSVIVPFMADQPFWGYQVARLGVGPKPIPRKKLTANRLAAAICQATTDPRMHEQAALLGKNIRQEDGVSRAVSLVRELLERDDPRLLVSSNIS